jgi:hypothetical protein
MKMVITIFCLLSASLLAPTFAHSGDLNDNGILINPDRSFQQFYHTDARVSCPAGTHLATVREAAQTIRAHGAKGILETNQVDPQNVPGGYVLISSVLPEDNFYFNPNGYNPPQEYAGDYGAPLWIWTSSGFPQLQHPDSPDWAFAYDIKRGIIIALQIDIHLPILCLQGGTGLPSSQKK